MITQSWFNTLLALFLSLSLSAQIDTTKEFVYGGFLVFPFEVPTLNDQGLNTRLSGLGFPAADYPHVVPGIGLQFQAGRMIISFTYNQSTRKKNTDTSSFEVEYRSTGLNLGYDMLKIPSFSLYPYVGFKGAGLNYLLKQTIRNTSFDNYLQTNLDHKEITNSRMHLDLGAGFSYQSWFIISVRAGYFVPLERVQWNINDNQDELGNAPEIRYSHYFSITLGIGNVANMKN